MSTKNQPPEDSIVDDKKSEDLSTDQPETTDADSADVVNLDVDVETDTDTDADADVEQQVDSDDADSVVSFEDQLAALQTQADEFKDSFLRSEAELENVRKRSEREIIKARKFALEKFAGDLLGVLDSLDMGQQAAQQDGATLESVREGAELTLKMFIDTLTKHGVEQINPTGEKFDPEEHEAMVMQPSADAEPNTVLDTFQKGYKLKDRVLRPARVVVAKAAE